MNIPYKGNLDWLIKSTVLFVRHGSHAYGTNTETSDEDFKGVCIPPRKYYLGFVDHFEQAESKSPDMVVYEIRKFFKLAAGCNPGILEVLFCDDSDVIVCGGPGMMLRDMRNDFLSRKALGTYLGYARSQMARIRSQRSDRLFNPNWKSTRNPVRLELEEKYGYDTKHAMHLVRLMRMCKEILTTGKVNVKRPDAAELIAIRNGKWSFRELEEWEKEETASLLSVASKCDSLPETPDMYSLSAMCAYMIGTFNTLF